MQSLLAIPVRSLPAAFWITFSNTNFDMVLTMNCNLRETKKFRNRPAVCWCIWIWIWPSVAWELPCAKSTVGHLYQVTEAPPGFYSKSFCHIALVGISVSFIMRMVVMETESGETWEAKNHCGTSSICAAFFMNSKFNLYSWSLPWLYFFFSAFKYLMGKDSLTTFHTWKNDRFGYFIFLIRALPILVWKTVMWTVTEELSKNNQFFLAAVDKWLVCV